MTAVHKSCRISIGSAARWRFSASFSSYFWWFRPKDSFLCMAVTKALTNYIFHPCHWIQNASSHYFPTWFGAHYSGQIFGNHFEALKLKYRVPTIRWQTPTALSTTRLSSLFPFVIFRYGVMNSKWWREKEMKKKKILFILNIGPIIYGIHWSGEMHFQSEKYKIVWNLDKNMS